MDDLFGDCDECGQKNQPLVRPCGQCDAAICPECIAEKAHWHRKSVQKQAKVNRGETPQSGGGAA